MLLTITISKKNILKKELNMLIYYTKQMIPIVIDTLKKLKNK